MRPLLLAMNNPVSRNPDHALYPWPEGCTGHRLWCMLADAARGAGLSEPDDEDYLSAFDRRNVLSSRQWSRAEARAAGAALLPALSGRRVVVLGVATLDALGLAGHRAPWGEWRVLGESIDLLEQTRDFREVRWCLLPHPSGRCREYNDPAVRMLAGETLLALYLGERGLPR